MRRQHSQKGFTLIELLVASFIFASVLAVVYGVLLNALKNKKELELTVSLGQVVKNVNEVLRTTVREANGDFLSESDFWPDQSDVRINLFVVLNDFLDPGNTLPGGEIFSQILNAFKNSVRGPYLYVKNQKEGKITVFWLDDSGREGVLKMKTWTKEVGRNRISWKPEKNDWTVLANFDKSRPHYFRIPAQSDTGANSREAKSIYNVSSEVKPFDLWVRAEMTLVKKWGRKELRYRLKQVYVPLIKANPYL